MGLMEIIRWINYIIAVIFVACYSYQFLYVTVALFKGQKKKTIAAHHRYAAIISARNEEKVIAHLIKSIRQQNYPAEFVDIFVVADNCTDDTAGTARDAGAIVYERLNKQQVGKGYALQYLFDRISEDYAGKGYDGYFIFDADNLLDENYITAMNKTFSAGHRIVTSYRNSKNYDSSWVSAGYSMWFMREARYLNGARMKLGSTCAVSGTGFLIHRDIIEKNGGWKHFLLTEDIEFTVDSVLGGESIAYCEDAMLYDEQPTKFGVSLHQRMRWAKGYWQVFRKYGARLFKETLTKGNFGCFDLAMAIAPAIVLTAVSIVANVISFFAGLALKDGTMLTTLGSIGESLSGVYVVFFGMGSLVVITEWKKIHAKTYKKILYCFTFPIFMMTYIPISFIALLKKVEWRPIRHDIARTLDDVRMAPERGRAKIG